jgi:hypothetical protein
MVNAAMTLPPFIARPRSGCGAFAATGYTAAVPPGGVMNSRRFN